jgi:hypothetical protein
MKNPAIALLVWILSGAFFGWTCYNLGKKNADRWYKSHTGDIWAPSSITVNGTTSSQTAGRSYFSNEEQFTSVRVRKLSGIPRVCSVAGDAFVLRSTGYLYVCSEKKWTWAIPTVRERDGKE